MIVRTFEGLQALTPQAPTWSPGGSDGGSLTLYDQRQAYAEIYATQPNVRICVDFLARNIAQLGLHVFRRLSTTDRARLNDHDLARWMGRPNPSTRRYRLTETLMGDLGIYFEAYWAKVRYERDGRPAIGLVPLPPEQMRVEGGLLPTQFVWTANGREKPFPLSEVVYFNGYNPTNRLRGLSPLETLRRILAEEAAAGDHREAFWRHAGRHETVIEQSKEAPNYTPPQLDRFREQLQEFSGRGAKVGQSVLLPKGMSFKSASFSARDSEYIQGGKLRREVCAAAFHIPQPMVGILDHATFSNIKEQHKHLYQDTLGPWLEMIQQEIEGQLLIECADQRDVYVEFNIDEKLKGTPEERASSLHTSTGRPWRTVNEARALENLPRIDDPELDKVAPQQGGPSDATARPARDARPATRDDDPDDDDADEDADEDTARVVAPVLHAARARQRARLQKLPAAERPAAFFAALDRWQREVMTDLTPLVGEPAAVRIAAQAVATLTLLEATT